MRLQAYPGRSDLGVLLAGEGGGVLVAASRRPSVALVVEGLAAPVSTPSGLPVRPVDDIGEPEDVDRVELLACETATRATVARWASTHGIEVVEGPPALLAVPPGVRVVAVSSTTTGAGKTALTRRVARILRRSGTGVAVLRHPLVNLLHWEGRFAPSVVRTPPEVDAPRPVEEREELAPVVGTGVAVVSGLDPERTLLAAAREAVDGVVVWDGGGAAAPWVRPDVHLVVVDLLREPPEGTDVRVAAADVVVLTKADSAPASRARHTEGLVRTWNPAAAVVLADLPVMVDEAAKLRDRRAVVVEDAPSLLLGGLRAGAGAVAARRFRCGVVVPRPFAVGSVARVLTEHPHIGPVIPSLGRTPSEIEDLAESVRATPGDVVLWASNANPAAILQDPSRPVVRAYGELTEVAGPSLQEVLLRSLADLSGTT
jgi:predicted GTPase